MTTECYITIHDQDLVLECEERGQFDAFERHCYLFVGPRAVHRIPSEVPVVVARELHPNYEHLPAFYDFTGWWALAAHGCISPSIDHIVTMQYDMHVIDSSIQHRVDQMLSARRGPIAFNAGYWGPNWMLHIPGFRDLYDDAMWSLRGIRQSDFSPFNEWPSTQGMAWRRDEFQEYMAWFTPFFDAFKASIWAGHLSERTVKAWCEVNHGEQYLLGVISHEAADMHGTGALMAGNRELYERRNRVFMSPLSVTLPE